MAEQFINLREYQRAGECYLAAGEHALADLAFIKAVDPETSPFHGSSLRTAMR